MTGVERSKKIFILAAPIVGGMIANNVVNLVDTAFVGYLGDNALAGVGIGLFINFIMLAIFLGLSVGVQTVTARNEGRNLTQQLFAPLNIGILSSLLVSIPLAVLVYKLIPIIFPLINSDTEINAQGVAYLRGIVLGLPGFGILICFKGYWTGINRPSVYLVILLIVNFINVVVAYMFVFGKCGLPAMGTFGVGLATSIALWLGAVLHLLLAGRRFVKSGFLKTLPDIATIKVIFELSIAEGIRLVFFAAAFMVIFYILGKAGTAEIAAANVLINVMLVLYLPILGLGSAVISLVSQSLGRNDFRQASQWGWDVTKAGVLVLSILSIPLIIFPAQLLEIFIKSPTTLAIAIAPLRITYLIVVLEGVRTILMSALLGACDNKWVVVVFLSIQWGLALPTAYVLVTFFKLGLLSVWLSQAFYTFLMAVIFAMRWQRKDQLAQLESVDSSMLAERGCEG